MPERLTNPAANSNVRIPVGRHSTGMDLRWLDSAVLRALVGVGGGAASAAALAWAVALDNEGLERAYVRVLGSPHPVLDGDVLFVKAAVGLSALVGLAFAVAALLASVEGLRDRSVWTRRRSRE